MANTHSDASLNGAGGAGSIPPWHALSVDEVAHRLSVVPARGLDSNEAATRLARHGANRLPEGRPRGAWNLLLAQFADVMIGILLIAAALSALLGDGADSIAILVIVLVNALIGFIQEVRAERAVAALRALSTPHAQVRRGDAILTAPVADLVPGDVVLLEAGALVPADLRLVDAADLSVAEAALTGESEAVAKLTGTLPVGTATADRRNLAFQGTLVTRGRATGLVVATGAATELGRVASLIAGAAPPPTPLQVRLASFGRRLAVAVLAVCALIFGAGIARGEPWLPMLMTAVSLAVAAIPEALPAVVAIALALGARRMAGRQALVRNLPAVETLGSVTHICSDKTGTLTENRMRVESYWVHGDTHRAADLPEEARARRGAWADMHHAMALVNDARPDAGGRVQGEPTEVALLEAALASGLEWKGLAATHPRVGERPFDSQRMRMSTLHRRGDGFVAFVKGAPESVLPLCTQGRDAGGEAVLDVAAAMRAAERMAREGQRVLAIAQRRFESMPERGAPTEETLVFLGLVGLIDPPRPAAREAVAECRAAGIVPIMITGDHPATARAMAATLGILGPDGAVLTGAELAALDDDALARRLDGVRVYARVDPAQKIRIVAALQAAGHCAAMTGDGVNDAPALKRADIGVAMGKGGTDVAREAADLVLLDDDFATIVHAVREGRRILDNIRRFILYAMTGNTGEIWVIAGAPLLGMPIALLPIHILWVNLVTDGIPGLALATEAAERGVMARPPRPVRENLFAGLWVRILWVGLLVGAVSLLAQAIALRSGAHAPTMVFTVLTLAQLLLALGLRSDRESILAIGLTSNRPLAAAVGLSIGMHLALIYVPALAEIFHTEPLAARDLAVCAGLAAVVLLAVEADKWRRRRAIG